MARIRADYVFGTLNGGGIDVDDTTLSSPQLTRLPAVTAPDVAALTLHDPDTGDYEIVHVTDHAASATTATVLRGQEGSAAAIWAAGTPWVNGITQADVAEFTADGGGGGGGFTGATILRKSSGQTVNNAWVAITWDIEDLDTLDLHSTVTNTSRLTATEDMVLYVNASLLMTGSAVTKYVSIRKNGSPAAMPTHSYLTLLSDGLYYLPLSGHIALAAGDYLEVWAYANSSSTAAASANSGEMHSRFSCHRVA